MRRLHAFALAWNALSNTGGYVAVEGGRFATTQLNESLTGNLTSPGIAVDRQYLTFDALGWGGGNVNDFAEANENYYLLLDDALTPVARINNNSGGTWTELAFDLTALGFAFGDTVHLRAVDGRSGGFGWMAVDNVRLTGEVIPEPASLALMGLGALLIVSRRRTAL